LIDIAGFNAVEGHTSVLILMALLTISIFTGVSLAAKVSKANLV
jgi:hypothetical protein